MILFLLFLLVPVIEIALYIEIGGVIGVWPSIGITFLTAAVGATIARAQGFSTLRELQSRLDIGDDPREPMAHGALLLVAGVTLLVPGFMTDAIGFLLLVPGIRAVVIRRLAKHMVVHSAGGHASAHGPGPHPRPGGARGPVVDGDYEVVDEEDEREPGDSGWTRLPK